MAGVIYVISHPVMPQHVKMGSTEDAGLLQSKIESILPQSSIVCLPVPNMKKALEMINNQFGETIEYGEMYKLTFSEAIDACLNVQQKLLAEEPIKELLVEDETEEERAEIGNKRAAAAEASPRKRQKIVVHNDVQLWLLNNLEDVNCDSGAMYEKYCRWVKAEKRTQLIRPAFARYFGHMMPATSHGPSKVPTYCYTAEQLAEKLAYALNVSTETVKQYAQNKAK
jgi:hypothetical protein